MLFLEGIGRFRPAGISLGMKFFKQTILSLIGAGVKRFLSYLKILSILNTHYERPSQAGNIRRGI
jgi:hypothetical protein